MLDSDDAKAMLNEIEKQDDVRVARILRTVWDDDNDDTFLWSCNGCSECGDELELNHEGFIWGKPLNNDKDCKHVSLQTYCSQKCVDAAISSWQEEVQVDIYVALVG